MGAEALPAIPQLGLAGALVAVIVYFMNSNRVDRRDAQAALVTTREEITALKNEIRAALAELEDQRRARWRAEEKVALLQRRLVTLTSAAESEEP